MSDVLATLPGPKDTFRLLGDLSDIEELLSHLKTTDEDDDDWHVKYSSRGFYDGPYTQSERDKEVTELTTLLSDLRSTDYLVGLIESMPKKKNGTFAKNRINTLFRADTNRRLFEDSFGWYAEEVTVKAVGDYELQLYVGGSVEKWS